VANVKDAVKNVVVSKTVGHVAFQFNVKGEAEGAFYLEIADGKISVESYEYYDRDIIIETTAAVIMRMLEEDLQPMLAYTNELMEVHGDVEQICVLPFGRKCKKKMYR
jgi:hypothetical protein